MLALKFITSAGEKFEMLVPLPIPGSISKKYSAFVMFWANVVAMQKSIDNIINSLFISNCFEVNKIYMERV
jgi:hypothetical protein